MVAPTKFCAALAFRSENFKFEAYAGGGAGGFCWARRTRMRMVTTTATMKTPMSTGRRLDSSVRVVGFGWNRPPMPGLYYWEFAVPADAVDTAAAGSRASVNL